MKNINLFYAASLLLACLLWTCNLDNPSIDEIQEAPTSPLEKKKGGKGNGNGGGTDDNSAALYQIEYIGPISNSTTYGPKTTSNKKFDLIETYGCVPVQMFGMDAVAGTTCFGSPCDHGHSIRQPDKRNAERRALAHFSFRDQDICGSGMITMTLYGDIRSQINGKYTLFPTSTQEPVYVDVDAWRVICSDGTPGCLFERENWTASPQVVKISLASITQCPGGNCN